ncbi:MAG: flagellin [Alphaproteobacteria bacterium]|nr:flagellin [Alphaproteobacteria bacterium]
MVNSINTNAGSLLGVRNLQRTNSLQAKTQNEISTGKKVNSAKDNAAILSVAQLLKADVAGLNSVKGSLDRAISTADVALSAGDGISNLLLDLKEKAVQAADPGLDDASRLALNDEFTALRDQISSLVDGASFNGTNAIASGGDDISAVTGADGQGAVTIQSQDLSLGGPNVTLGAAQDISSASNAQAAVSAIEDSISNLSSALSEIGAGANQLQQTKEFTEALSNATEEGISNLVDADLASTNAAFEANKVKEALGIKALSIANSQPASLLSLFRQP